MGKSPFILSHAQFKRVLLTGQLSLLTFFVCSGYLVFDAIQQIGYAWPYQLGCALLALVSFMANRNRRHRLAKVLLALAVNITVFIFASTEPASTGLYAFYIPLSLGALAVFGYEERHWAFGLIGFSILLLILSFAVAYPLIDNMNMSPYYIRMNQIVNLFSATTASIFIIYFLISVNHNAETALKENEAQLLRKNDELLKVNAELDRFVYSTSHDLRAPLSSIRGLLQLADRADHLNELKTYIKLMTDRVHTLDKFIQDISDYARNARQTVEPQEVPVRKMIREVLESLEFFPGADRIQVTLDVPDDLRVTTDATRLKMIMSNLVSNAFKYSDPQKENSEVRITSEQNDAWLSLTVEDNGIGIPSENLSRVFDMFYRAHETSNGSGLGLYIVKETVEKLNGRISVASSLGNGSRFCIELPST
jgi:signal transduction histidine kinase